VLYRRALEIDEKSLGSEHVYVATDLNNLARLLQATNRIREAEPRLRRALAIDLKSYGTDHPSVATDLNNLAILRSGVGDWVEAAELGRRAKSALVARTLNERDAGGAKSALARNTWALRADASSAASREEGYELAQWALQT